MKHNFLVKRLEDLADTIKKAFYIATTGRPGPVVIDIPKDITDPGIKIPYHYPNKVKMRSYNPVVKGHLGQIKKAVKILMEAERPVFYTGGGVVLDDAAQAAHRPGGYPRFPDYPDLDGTGRLSWQRQELSRHAGDAWYL